MKDNFEPRYGFVNFAEIWNGRLAMMGILIGLTTELLTNPLVMEESEILKVQASDANELHVIASILEIQPREVTT